MKNKILEITYQIEKGYMTSEDGASQLMQLFDMSGWLPLTFEQCLREEFLIGTQNFPTCYVKFQTNAFFYRYGKSNFRWN